MEKATVQSIDRALSIVEALAGEKEGLGVTEISTRVGLHKSTVHRLLSALGERGYVVQRFPKTAGWHFPQYCSRR